MKRRMKVKNVITAALSVAALLVCYGCGTESSVTELTLEAGDHELLSILCGLEGIDRVADPDYVLQVTDNDGWNPFQHGGQYLVTYEKQAARGTDVERKSARIFIVDTQPPSVSVPEGCDAVVMVPFPEEPSALDAAIFEAVRESLVVRDNASTSKIPLNRNNLTIVSYNADTLDRPQEVAIRVTDSAGNTAEITLRLMIQARAPETAGGNASIISNIKPESSDVALAETAVRDRIAASGIEENPIILQYELLEVEMDEEYTGHWINMYIDSEFAKNKGWTQDTLVNHFLAIRSIEAIEVDPNHLNELGTEGAPGSGLYLYTYIWMVVEDDQGNWEILSGQSLGPAEVTE